MSNQPRPPLLEQFLELAEAARGNYGKHDTQGEPLPVESGAADSPSLFMVANGSGNPKSVVDVSLEQIDPANDPANIRTIEYGDIALDQREKEREPIIAAISENTEASKQILAAIKENTAKREKDVFSGAYRAQSRFDPLEDEIEIEKICRLKNDGCSWKEIVKQVYPNTKEENLDSAVERVKKMYQRDQKRLKEIS